MAKFSVLIEVFVEAENEEQAREHAMAGIEGQMWNDCSLYAEDGQVICLDDLVK